MFEYSCPSLFCPPFDPANRIPWRMLEKAESERREEMKRQAAAEQETHARDEAERDGVKAMLAKELAETKDRAAMHRTKKFVVIVEKRDKDKKRNTGERTKAVARIFTPTPLRPGFATHYDTERTWCCRCAISIRKIFLHAVRASILLSESHKTYAELVTLTKPTRRVTKSEMFP